MQSWFSTVRANVWAWRQHRRSAREQAKRIRAAKREMRIQARYEADREWHEWFAWYPVFDRINGLSMFGERILRKQTYRPDNFLERFFGWEYRPITILPKDIGLTTDGIQ